MKRYFYSISIVSVLLISCSKSKESEKNLNHSSFSKNALEYVQLKQGSYYIYKDSASGNLDSIVVPKSLLENRYIAASSGGWSYNPAYTTEEFTLTMEHVLPSYEWFSGTATASSIGFAFFNSDTAQVYLYSNNGHSSFSQTHSQINTLSITVEGKTYNNVNFHQFENGYAPTDPSYISEIFFWAKGYGIIKRTLIKGPNRVTKTSLLIRNG